MDNIYAAHNSNINFKEEYYKPIRESRLGAEFNIVFPYEKGDEHLSTKNYIKQCKYFIAEVSYPSTGLGIEMGWADMNDVEIICLYKKGNKVSPSLGIVTDNIIEFEDAEDMVEKLENILLG